MNSLGLDLVIDLCQIEFVSTYIVQMYVFWGAICFIVTTSKSTEGLKQVPNGIHFFKKTICRLCLDHTKRDKVFNINDIIFIIFSFANEI